MGLNVGFHDDFAREGRPKEVRRLNQLVEIKVDNWGKRWTLDGIHVRCRHCGGKQKLSEAGKPFFNHHKANCAFSSNPAQIPFGELADILSGWRFELWDDETDLC
jgi:hypothetical protein